MMNTNAMNPLRDLIYGTRPTEDGENEESSNNSELSLPGPFVVFQGMRGDGMANTMDSMPVLIADTHSSSEEEEEGGQNSRSAAASAGNENENNNNNNDVAEGGGDNLNGSSIISQEEGELIQQPSDDNDDDLATSITSIPQEISRRIIGQEGENENNNSMNRRSSSNNSSSSGLDDNERDVVGIGLAVTQQHHGQSSTLYDSMSTTSSLEVIMPMMPLTTSSTNLNNEPETITARGETNPTSTDNNNNTTRTARIRESASIASDGGLHLPIPPSAVAGMGYNSILPHVCPLVPPTTTTNMTNRNSRNEGGGEDQHHQQLGHDDSFVMVNDTTTPAVATSSAVDNTTTQHPISDQQRRSSSTTTSTSSSTSSSAIDIIHHPSSSSNNNNQQQQNDNMTIHERRSIKQWNKECRQNEKQRREDMLLHSSPQQSSGGRTTTSSRSGGNGNSGHQNVQWWKGKKSNCLSVFESLPKLDDHNVIETGRIVGELPPGCTVLGMEMIRIHEDTLEPIEVLEEEEEEPMVQESQQGTITTGKNRTYQFLRIESPFNGYVLYGTKGYTYLGPGLPSSYAEPDVWTWRVTCPEGAYIRQGLELTSVHVDTIPYGSFVKVTRKTVNAMGLSRLRVETSYLVDNSSSGAGGRMDSGGGSLNVPFNSTTATLRNRASSSAGAGAGAGADRNNTSGDEQNNIRSVVGWVSEALNPLSGQSGPVVQPMPLPVPVLYRVTLVGGAVIRSDVELSSPQIGHAPLHSILTIVGRAYSNHPQDRCIERLQLAGGGGWVSVRLNRPPPMDELVLEMVSIDGTFDPNEPGLYHIERQKQVLQEYNDMNSSPSSSEDSAGNATTNNERRGQGNYDQSQNRVSRSLQQTNTGGDISSINDEEDGETAALENSGELSNAVSSVSSVAAVPALYRSGVAVGAGAGSDGSGSSGKACGNKAQADEMCLICLTEKRTATIVHGSTGHIACCLMCARILKGRGDRCPVCRLPIDSVIQQFWA